VRERGAGQRILRQAYRRRKRPDGGVAGENVEPEAAAGRDWDSVCGAVADYLGGCKGDYSIYSLEITAGHGTAFGAIVETQNFYGGLVFG
jgi:hypothetical protein